MSRRVGARLRALLPGGLAVALLVSSAGPAPTAGQKAAVVLTAGELKWSEDPAVKGARMAVLWGDPQRGAHGALKALPAGTSLAAHVHTHDQRVVGITGTITLAVEGSPAKDMGPGSYAFIPGGVKHTAECKPGADCTYFEEQQGPSDMKLVETPTGSD